MAAHPWPDAVADTDTLTAIAAELLPSANAPTFDPAEVAADRLFRLSEAMTHAGAAGLADVYHTNARVLLDADRGPERTYAGAAFPGVGRGFVASPWGTGVPIARAATGTPGHRLQLAPPGTERADQRRADDGSERPQDFTAASDRLFGLAVARDEPDLGRLLGGEADGVTVAAFAERLSVRPPLSRFDAAAAGLSDRDRSILESRAAQDCIWEQEYPTLEELGRDWKVTRERIRQIEKKERSQLAAAGDDLTAFAEGLFADLREQAVEIEIFEHRLRRASDGCLMPNFVMGRLVELGGWRGVGGWAIGADAADRLRAVRRELEDAASDNEPVTDQILATATAGYFGSGDARDQFVRDEWGWARVPAIGWLPRDTMAARLVGALRALGRSATKEELAAVTDLTQRQVGSGLQAIEDRFARVTKDTWDLIENVPRPYHGIVAEIQSRIDAGGGRTSRSALIEELPRDYHVSVNSVTINLQSPLFVVTGDDVRRADTSDFDPGPPDPARGCTRVGEVWGQSVELEERHLSRGYSLAIDFAVAHANGVRPGDSLRVPVGRQPDGADSTSEEASVIYRLQSTNGRIDVGRVGDFLRDEGFEPGDRVIVAPTPEFVVIRAAGEADDQRGS